jgi:hypothetical protein
MAAKKQQLPQFVYRGNFDFVLKAEKPLSLSSRRFDRIIRKFFDAVEAEGFDEPSFSLEDR